MAIFGRSKSGKNTDDKTKAGTLGGFGLDISPEALAERFDLKPDNVPEFMEWHKQFVTQHGRQPLDDEIEDQANSLRKLNELAHEGKDGKGVGTPTGMLLTIYDKYIQSVMGVIASAQQSGSIAPAQIQASEQIAHEARQLDEQLNGASGAAFVGEKKDPKENPFSLSFMDESIDKFAKKYEEFASASGLDDLRSYWQTTNKNPGILELRKQIADEEPEARGTVGDKTAVAGFQQTADKGKKPALEDLGNSDQKPGSDAGTKSRLQQIISEYPKDGYNKPETWNRVAAAYDINPGAADDLFRWAVNVAQKNGNQMPTEAEIRARAALYQRASEQHADNPTTANSGQVSLDVVLSSYREYTDAVQGAVDQLRQKGSLTPGMEDKLDDISVAIKDVRTAMAGHGTFTSESPDGSSVMTATAFQDINDSIDALRTEYTSLKNDTQIDQFEDILGDEQNLAYSRTNILTDLKMGTSSAGSPGRDTESVGQNNSSTDNQASSEEEEIEFRVPHGNGGAATSQTVTNVSSNQGSSQSEASSSNRVTTSPSLVSNDGAVTHMQAQANAAAEANSYYGQRREGIRATLGQAAEAQYVGWYRQQIAAGHTPTTGEVNAYIAQLNTRFGLGGVLPHAVSQPGVWGQGATDLSAQNAQVEARGNNIGRDYGAEAQGEFSDWFWDFVRQNGRQPTYGEVDAATDRIISGRTYLPDAPQANTTPNNTASQAPAYDSESAVQRLALQLANEHGPAAASALSNWYRQQSSDGTPPTFAQMQAQRRAIDAMFTASDRPSSAPAPFSASDLDNLVNNGSQSSGTSNAQVPYGVPLTQADIDNFAELYPNSILPSVGDILADPSEVDEPAGGPWANGYNPTAAWQGEMEDKRLMREAREQNPQTGIPVRPAGTGGFFQSQELQANAQAAARREQAVAAAQNATQGVGQDGEILGQQVFGPSFSMDEHADNVQARLETEAQAALQDFLANAPPGSDPSILNEHFNNVSGAGSQFNVNFSPDGNITVVPKNGTRAQSALMEAAFDDLRANDNPYAGGVGSRGAPGAAAAAAARRRRAEELLTAGFEHDQQAMAEAAERTRPTGTNVSDSNTLAAMAGASAMPAYNPDTMSDSVQQSYQDQAEAYGIDVNNLDDYDRWVANFIASNGRQPNLSEQEAQLDKIRALESAADAGPVRPSGAGGFFQSQEAQESAQSRRDRAKNMEGAFDELRDSGNPYVGGVSFGRPGGAAPSAVPQVTLTDEQAETLGTADYDGSIAPGTVVTTDDGRFLIDENGVIQSTEGMSASRIRELNRYLAGGGTWAEYFEDHTADDLYGMSGGGGTRVQAVGLDDFASPDGIMHKDTFQKGIDEGKDSKSQEKLLGSATLADKYDQWVAQFTARNRRPPSSRERSEFLNRTAQVSPMSLAAAVATTGANAATAAPQNAAYNASTGATSTGIVSTGLGVSQPSGGSLKTPGIETASAAGRQTLKGLDGQMGSVTAPASGFALKNSSTGMGVTNVSSPTVPSAPFVKPTAPVSSATIRNQQTSTIKSEVSSPYRPQNDATVLHISRQTTSASTGSKTMDSLKSSVSGAVSNGVTSGVKTSQTLNGAVSGGITSGVKTAVPIKPALSGGIAGGVSSGAKTTAPIKSAVSGGVTSGIKTPVVNPAATPTKTIPIIKPTTSAPVVPKTVAAAPKVAAPAPAPTTTTVKAGDGWYALASKNGTTVDALLKANGATLNTVIHPGQSIKVPAKSATGGGVTSGVTGTKTASPSYAKTPAASSNKTYSPVKNNASKVTNSYTPPKSASKTISSIPGSSTPKKTSNIAPKAY